MSDELPIRSWGITTYRRVDNDARRPTGGTRFGRWHAFEDSALGPTRDRRAAVTLLAICGRWVTISLQDWHDGEDPPGLNVVGGIYPGMALRTVRRRVCQGCLRRQVESGR